MGVLVLRYFMSDYLGFGSLDYGLRMDYRTFDEGVKSKGVYNGRIYF